MKIVIIENELYLAQSISAKLVDNGFEVDIYGTVKEAMSSNGDVYLLSTSLPGQNFSPLVKKFAHKIIILMVNYINNNTVSEPLELGAKDYIVKPFKIEELLRKINHYQEYQELKSKNNLFEEYTHNLLKDLKYKYDIEQLTPPVVISTNYQRLADKVVFNYIKYSKKNLVLISLGDENWLKKITECNKKSLLYIINIELLKKTERNELFKVLDGYNFIISTTSTVETPFNTVTIASDSKIYDQNEILTIDDYVKFIVNSFQYQFPDTELSKKLGISRKSLWEKRKKYGIFKKK
ncbi:Possible two-component regulator [hydrothermal vent metagenome]|uniref:Possible two-component regulator n=1 Tax=hydrothermal vent metagenome TaxID=652676 RepID=A0A1W1EJF3_9ZZZZ